MSWTRPPDLHAQVQRLWDSGQLLAILVTGESIFPLRLKLKTPSVTEITERFAEVRDWIAALRAMPHIRLEMREHNHRVLGQNTLPAEVSIDTIEATVALLGKQRAVDRFAQLLEQTRRNQPLLLDWLAKRSLLALELYDEWSRLLAIVAWLQLHPRPQVYLRQADIADVHSKFIESHRGVLLELLDRALPPDAIDMSASGVNQFASRYGFRGKPAQVRFRILDASRALLPTGGDQDMTIDAESFARLNPKIARVFITENEINFLAFPAMTESMVIFGAGYGFEGLAKVVWLNRCAVYYWGDIDTHGFAILDQLRVAFSHVQSLLMDRQTLLAHQSQWVTEPQPLTRDLARLGADEQALFDDLRDNRIGAAIRLEQERIRFGWIKDGLTRLSLSG